MREKIQHIKQYVKTHKKLFVVLAIVKLLLKIGIIGYFLFVATECNAQTTNKLIRNGNRLYNKGKFNDATEQYSKALQQEPKNEKAIFNHSDALYQLKEYKKAEEQFTAITKTSSDPKVRSKAFYNLGNTYYKQQKYAESVKAYKESLKLNPADKDAKYNLMMAMAKLKDNKGGGGNDNQDKKEDKKQPQEKKPSPQNQQPSKPEDDGKMSKTKAEGMLEEAENEESKVQQKLDKKKAEIKEVKVEKDW